MHDESAEFMVPSPKRQRVGAPNSTEVVDDLDNIYDPIPAATDHVAQSPALHQSPVSNDRATNDNEIPSLPGLGNATNANTQGIMGEAVIMDPKDAFAEPEVKVMDLDSDTHDCGGAEARTTTVEPGDTQEIEGGSRGELLVGSPSEKVKAQETDSEAGNGDEIMLDSESTSVAEASRSSEVAPGKLLGELGDVNSRKIGVDVGHIDEAMIESSHKQAVERVLTTESHLGQETTSGAMPKKSGGTNQDVLELVHTQAPGELPFQSTLLGQSHGGSEVVQDDKAESEVGNNDKLINSTAERSHEAGPLVSVNSAMIAAYDTPKIPDVPGASMNTLLDPISVKVPTFKDLAEANMADPEAEFEMDSSPIESSDSDSSDYTSSSDSGGDEYEMLDPEEQARRLMGEDGGSDDEAGGKGSKDTAPLRTVNETPEEIVPKPDVVVTEDMRIEELGRVENVVENLVLIKAKTSGEYQVLEFGSVLCLEDRTVIGSVAETLGRVQQPYYSVRFTNKAAISEAGLSKDTRVFYVEAHSNYTFTQPLKAFKGSDASNIHDEEVGDDELEFSDDEAEAEHKRRTKSQRHSRRDGRDGDTDGSSRGPRGARGRGRGGRQRGGPQMRSHDTSSVPERPPVAEFPLNYDDGEGMAFGEKPNGDELYTPLARPMNLHQMMRTHEAPVESYVHRIGSNREYADRGRGRGRADHGSDRSRGRGHGFFQTNRNSICGNRRPQLDGIPVPPVPPQHSPSSQGLHRFGHVPMQQSEPEYVPNSYAQSSGNAYPHHDPHQYPQQYPQQYQQQFSGYAQSLPQQHPSATQYGQPQQQQPYTNYGQPQDHQVFQQSPTYSPMVPNIPPGAHINPAFFQQRSHNSFPPTWQQENGYGNNSWNYPQ